MKAIRDPVHDYIYVTPIEERIIDEPQFQRLRFVLQNSCAHLTYPSNTSTRFLHSLGVLHLSGQMFLRAMESAGAAVLTAFLDQGHRTIERARIQLNIQARDLRESWEATRGDLPSFHHVSGAMTLTADQTLCYHALWQAIRLCALIHDIGHLPLSHLFEHALSRYHTRAPSRSAVIAEYERRLHDFLDGLGDLKQHVGAQSFDRGNAVHENIGMMVFAGLSPSIKVSGPVFYPFASLVHRLANVIFLLNTETVQTRGTHDEYQLLRCLHTIVAGALDADRLDYCVRDPFASGMELGAIDVHRIVEAMVLHREDGGAFRIVPEARALPAIQSFFHQRYLMYRNLVYHHNVVRMNGIAQEILVRLLQATAAGGAGGPAGPGALAVAATLADFGFWKPLPGGRYAAAWLNDTGFEHCDDTWLRCLMVQLFTRLQAAAPLGQWESELFLLLDTMLHRKRENVFTLWKHDTDYDQTIHELTARITSKNGTLRTSASNSHPLTIFRGDPAWVTLVDDLADAVAGEGVILIYDYLAPKTMTRWPARLVGGDSGPELLVGGRIQKIDRVCSYLRVLDDVASNTPNVHFSFVGEGLKSDHNGALRIKVRDLAMDRLERYLTK